MPETKKLYDDDPYLVKFEAEVLSVEGNRVVLDQTVFYPEGGGQAGDTGTVGNVRVVDTQIDGDTIIHLTEFEPSFSVGDVVEGAIDWERRYKIMKHHSAAHIMEHFLWKRFGKLERLGSFVDDQKDRADYSYDGRLPPEELKLVEDNTNAFLAEGREINIDSEPLQPEIRVWRCGPIEMHCAGTHVKNTNEIGPVKLKRKNPGRGKERIETSII